LKEELREMINNKAFDSPIERLALDIVPRLVAIEGPLCGRTFYLDEPALSIGRLVSNDICLEDPFVSRKHCVIRTEKEHYVIRDLNSANGTLINGERVNAGLLKEGSLIGIGASLFVFRLPEDIRSKDLRSEISDPRIETSQTGSSGEWSFALGIKHDKVNHMGY
jgi:pSer/pThr/pTyr-binding forkhead associated (FHA) protein